MTSYQVATCALCRGRRQTRRARGVRVPSEWTGLPGCVPLRLLLHSALTSPYLASGTWRGRGLEPSVRSVAGRCWTEWQWRGGTGGVAAPSVRVALPISQARPSHSPRTLHMDALTPTLSSLPGEPDGPLSSTTRVHTPSLASTPDHSARPAAPRQAVGFAKVPLPPPALLPQPRPHVPSRVGW